MGKDVIHDSSPVDVQWGKSLPPKGSGSQDPFPDRGPGDMTQPDRQGEMDRTNTVAGPVRGNSPRSGRL